jgi:hypothetical protein
MHDHFTTGAPASDCRHPTTVGNVSIHRGQHARERGQRASRREATLLPSGNTSLSAKRAVLPTSYVLPTSEERHPTTVGNASIHRGQHARERGQRASRREATLPPPGSSASLGEESPPPDVVRPSQLGRTSSDNRGQCLHPWRAMRLPTASNPTSTRSTSFLGGGSGLSDFVRPALVRRTSPHDRGPRSPPSRPARQRTRAAPLTTASNTASTRRHLVPRSKETSFRRRASVPPRKRVVRSGRQGFHPSRPSRIQDRTSLTHP